MLPNPSKSILKKTTRNRNTFDFLQIHRLFTAKKREQLSRPVTLAGPWSYALALDASLAPGGRLTASRAVPACTRSQYITTAITSSHAFNHYISRRVYSSSIGNLQKISKWFKKLSSFWTKKYTMYINCLYSCSSSNNQCIFFRNRCFFSDQKQSCPEIWMVF